MELRDFFSEDAVKLELDGTTKDIHVLVPPGDWLNFVCAGNSGGCAYSVTSE